MNRASSSGRRVILMLGSRCGGRDRIEPPCNRLRPAATAGVRLRRPRERRPTARSAGRAVAFQWRQARRQSTVRGGHGRQRTARKVLARGRRSARLPVSARGRQREPELQERGHEHPSLR